MKLSELQVLMDAMTKKATQMGIADPNIEFWIPREETDKSRTSHFDNLEPHPNAAAEIHDHVVQIGGTAAARGDFAIPMRRC